VNPVLAPLVNDLIDTRELLCCQSCGGATSFINPQGQPCCANCAAGVDCYKDEPAHEEARS
jgi:hypothetical protein